MRYSTRSEQRRYYLAVTRQQNRCQVHYRHSQQYTQQQQSVVVVVGIIWHQIYRQR